MATGYTFLDLPVLQQSHSFVAGDETLKEGDLGEVVEAILDAKDKAYEIGLKLKLPPSEVKSICKTHQDPQERLTAVIDCSLKQVEPRPTWRLIVEALRSPLVNLPRLAEEVEANNFPNTTCVVPRNGMEIHLHPPCLWHIIFLLQAVNHYLGLLVMHQVG